MLHIKEASDIDDARKLGKPVVVDFFATWCGPCKTIAPRFLEFVKEYPHIKFLTVDIDDFPEVAAKYDVRAMPTFAFFGADGKLQETMVGARVPSLIKLLDAFEKPQPEAESK